MKEVSQSAMIHKKKSLDINKNGLPSTFVPGRNALFLTVAAMKAYEKKIDVDRFYDTERYSPHYHNCMGMPQFIMTSD